MVARSATNGKGCGLTKLRAEPRGTRLLPRRLMARQRILIPFIEVRILAGHPTFLQFRPVQRRCLHRALYGATTGEAAVRCAQLRQRRRWRAAH